MTALEPAYGHAAHWVESVPHVPLAATTESDIDATLAALRRIMTWQGVDVRRRYSSGEEASGRQAPLLAGSDRPVKPKHLVQAASACRVALDPFVEDDWGAVQAGGLTWDVRQTVTHVCDAVRWYAAQLASRSPAGSASTSSRTHDASNAELLDVLKAAAVTLAQVAGAAPADARAYHDAGMADAEGFLVHGWDAVRGFGREFAVPEDLAGRVLRRLFPWAPTDVPLASPVVGKRAHRLSGAVTASGARLGLASRAPRRVGRHRPAPGCEPAHQLRMGPRCRPLAPTLATQASATAVP